MSLFLIAGEPSGDALGAALMAGLRDLSPDVRFNGIGGPLMTAQGLDSRFPMQELSLMGLIEVLPRYFHLKRRIEETAQAIAAARPEALITIDSPDFCLRVARRARALWPDLRVIHYVAPSVWAWRPGRAAKMAPVVDHVLALLPFEPPYMQAAGMSCDFVGHPIAGASPASPAEAAAFRAAKGIAADAPVVLCLPGSRRGEIRQLTARFGETLGLVAAQMPGLAVVLPTLDGLRDEIAARTADWPVPPLIVTDAAGKAAAFAAADAALAASGTVSLELALNGVPMVIAYDMAPISRSIILRMMRTDTVTLVNLVSETRAVPEFIAGDCRPGPMAAALTDLLKGGPARQAQLDAMALTMQRLGQGGEPPGLRAARSVLAQISPAPPPR